MDSTTISERCDQWNHDLSVDTGRRLVRDVALAGLNSRNGYRYSPSALREATTLYEGKPVFLDHGSNRREPQNRSTRDLVGSITNPTFQDERIRGDIRVLDTESGRTFLKLLEIESPGIGMSHVVQAVKSADGRTVEQIVDVISVDVVVNPATTSTFCESTDANQREQDRRNVSPDLHDGAIMELQQQCTSLQTRNEELEALVESLQTENRIHNLLADSNLPDTAVSKFFVSQLRQARDDSTRRQLIEDRFTLISERSDRRPSINSQGRIAETHQMEMNQKFIQAIRRR